MLFTEIIINGPIFESEKNTFSHTGLRRKHEDNEVAFNNSSVKGLKASQMHVFALAFHYYHIGRSVKMSSCFNSDLI